MRDPILKHRSSMHSKRTLRLYQYMTYSLHDRESMSMHGIKLTAIARRQKIYDIAVLHSLVLMTEPIG